MFNRAPKSGLRMQSRSIGTLKYGILLSFFVLLSGLVLKAQTARPNPTATQTPRPISQSAGAFADASGMYSFEREGEFVQVNIEQAGPRHDASKPLAVTGFISRYADTESDRGAFLDYFFTKGSLTGGKIAFTTKVIHGLSYEFSGVIVRGAVPRDKDGYYEIRGTLTQNTVADEKVTSAKTREITMKLYPELDEAAPRTK
jgi:hypothetical protein